MHRRREAKRNRYKRQRRLPSMVIETSFRRLQEALAISAELRCRRPSAACDRRRDMTRFTCRLSAKMFIDTTASRGAASSSSCTTYRTVLDFRLRQLRRGLFDDIATAPAPEHNDIDGP